MSTSCETCPSRVQASDTATHYKVALDSDVCLRYGHILSRPKQPESVNVRIRETFAKSCPSFGAPAPDPAPEFPTAQVAIGDPLAVAALATRPPRTPAEAPSACSGCEFYVRPSAVKTELGWAEGLCAIKGRLVLRNRIMAEAQGCADGRRGVARDTAMDVILQPAYDPAIANAVKVQVSSVKPIPRDKHRTDPREYESDKPTDAQDALLHIRAWRQVDDPEGRNDPLWLPIFDGPALYGFDPRTTYGSMRPDLYVDHQGLLYDLVAEMYEQGKTPILEGPAGTGKTEMACWLAWLMDLEFTRYSIRPNTETFELMGSPSLTAEDGVSVTNFNIGRFPKAIVKPGVICIDEYNAANDDLMFYFRPILDGDGRLVIDGDRPDLVFERHPFNFIVGTQNPPGDPIYRGVQQLSAADFSRVSGIAVGYPPETVERAILTERCKDFGFDLDPVVCDKIMQIAQDIREQIKNGTLQIAWGVRDNIDVAIKTRYYSLEKAFRRAGCDLLEQEVADIIIASVRSVA